MVSATIRPPALRARSLGTSWRGTRSGTEASMVRTFQFSGGRMAALMSTKRSISSSENWSRQPATIASSWVPSCSATARERARSSAGRACREATGAPEPSEWVEDWVVDRPQAPASMASWKRSSISWSCSGVGWPPTAASPMTWRRRAQCPTMKPAVDGDPPLQGVEVLAEGRPGPVDALFERLEGHALDLAHHAARVVGVLGAGGVERGQGEAAVPARRRWSRRGSWRGWRTGPRRAGRRSACGGRRSRGSGRGRWRPRWCGPLP